jgi:tetratricopeptide (TPR) repeat protein
MEVGKIEGDLTVVDRRTIIQLVVNSGPAALEAVVKQLTAVLNLDKRTFLTAPEAPSQVDQQIGEITAAEQEIAARGIATTPQAAYHLGMLAAYRRAYDTALAYFRQAMEADPEYADAFEAIAWLQQSRAEDDLFAQRYDAASQRLAEARAAAMHTDPTDTHALALRGYIAKTLAQLADARHDKANREKYYTEAARLFEQAAQLDPASSSAQNGLGNVQHALGNLDAAITAYSRAVELVPGYAAAHHDLALAYEGKMQADQRHAGTWRRKALREWLAFCRLAPSDPGFSEEYIQAISQHSAQLASQITRRRA